MANLLRLGVAFLLGAASLVTGASPASAMGSGNPYEDLQVGVTYTVYQPQYTGGLRLAHTGSQAGCPEGTEQNMVAVYGSAKRTDLSIIEGNPICGDPTGAGKSMGAVQVRGAKAHLEVYCDPANRTQWKSCSRADVARYGGALSVTLPGYGKLRPTEVVLVTYGSKPLTYAQLLKVARTMQPVAGDQQLIGGMATCTQADFGDVLAAGMPKGEVLVSVDEFRCDNGWAYAFATTGDGKGHNIGQTFIFEAEGQFWIPKDPAAVCGTWNSATSETRPSDAQVPAGIWTPACRTN
jgi:hypothetical protein